MDEPLQLIEFIPRGDKTSKEIKLNEDNLDHVISRCDNRPVSVFCVCGPSRRGKSFLLGYMLRCLEGLEKGQIEWMDWDNPKKPLSGFKFRSGLRPETQGIWIWSRPFVIKNEEDQEVCVLLVDTQGTQDEFSTTQEMTAIVGLSLLTSSVVIFNFFTDLQEDVLVTLNTYIQYGLMAMENLEDGVAPFQKLTFLIRDWNTPGDYPFGGKGGKRFLEEKLQIKDDQPEEAKTLRRTINKCFQNLDCFLLPHIGAKALSTNFKGSIAELDEKFAHRLEEFINGLINEDDILIKEVLGKPILASELESYLKMYVNTFNSDVSPSPSNILEATVKLHNDAIVESCLEKYKERLTSKIEQNDFHTQEDIEEAHKSAQQEALGEFTKAKKFGDSNTIETYRTDLIAKISEYFKTTGKQNEEKSKRITAEACNHAVSAYKKHLKSRFVFSKYDLDFYEDAEIQEIEIPIRNQIVEDFKTKLKGEDEDKFEQLLDALIENLDDVLEGFLSKNNLQRSQAQEKISNIVKKLVEEYNSKMGEHLKNNAFLEPFELDEHHETEKLEIVESFLEMDKPGNTELQNEYQQKLEDSIDEAYETLKQRYTLSLKESWEDALAAVNEEYKIYLNNLRTLSALDGCKNRKVLHDMHLKRKQQLQRKLLTSFPFPMQSDYYKKLTEAVEEKADMAFEIVANEVEKDSREFDDNIKSALDKSCKFYRQEMKAFLDTGIINQTVLEMTHKQTKIDSIEIFKRANKSDPGLHEHVTKLEAMLDEIYPEFQKENANKQTEATLEALKLVNQCHSDYEDAMKRSLENDKESLAREHEEYKANILENFEKRCPIKSPEFLQDHLKTLKEKLENSYKLFLKNKEISFMKSEGSDSGGQAVDEGVEYYKREMRHVTNEKYADEQIIDQEHARIAKESEEKLKQKFIDSTPFGNTEALAKYLEEFQSKLDVALNSLKSENNDKLKSAKVKAETLKKECRDEYAKIMKRQGESAESEDDLSLAHDIAKQKVLKKFKNECPIKSKDFMTPYLAELEKDIDETFDDYVEFFELRSSEDDFTSKEIIHDCTHLYLEEMENQYTEEETYTSDELYGLHQYVVDMVIEKLGESDPLTETQIEEVTEEMEILFEQFKNKNAMKQNYGEGVVPAIGIDLGTTYCCVGVYINGKVEIIRNELGNLTTPSYVMFCKDNNEVVVGDTAKDLAYRYLENTIFDAKRIIGRKMRDPVLQKDMKSWPFTVVEDDGVPKLLVNEKLLYPEQVSAKLLAYLRSMAEKYLKLSPGAIKKAVITVPAYFNDGQRQATIDAGTLAGLEVLTILNEPTAAAIAYSIERLEKSSRKVLVYDLGGGTFDVAVLDMKPNNIEVLAVDGDTHLGGEDFDKNLMTYCVEQYKEQTGIDLFDGINDPNKHRRSQACAKLSRLKHSCEKYKQQLSTARVTKVVNAELDLEVDLTRDTFNDLNEAEFQTTIDIVDRAINAAGLRKQEIDDVVLVGGSSRIVKVQELLRDYFEGKALDHTIHPDHCVAYGAAVKAAIMNGERAVSGVNNIQDVAPYSLGIEVKGGKMSVIIPKNTNIPCRKTQTYTTTMDNQTKIDISIFQGENNLVEDNEHLGDFVLNGIPPARKGTESTEVSMEVDSMGILHVEALCRSNRTKNRVSITENKHRMSKETIKRLLAEEVNVNTVEIERSGSAARNIPARKKSSLLKLNIFKRK